jgi:hypothetical protein
MCAFVNSLTRCKGTISFFSMARKRGIFLEGGGRKAEGRGRKAEGLMNYLAFRPGVGKDQ